MRSTLFIALLISTICVYAQITPNQLGFQSDSIISETLGTINYFVSNSDSEDDLPLLVYLDGSGAFPLFQYTSQGIGSTVVINFQKLAANYQIVLISKPGVPFIDSVGNNENGLPVYSYPQDYTEKLSLNWRVFSADTVINHLLSKRKKPQQKAIVFGISEGAQVGPYLAAKNRHISHLILLAGNGLNQFFDPIITARNKAISGVLSETEAQAEIDTLYQQYKTIYAQKYNTNKEWWGHTYQRWASFTNKDPLEYLRTLDIPIYIANGSLDENSVLSADYVYLDFIRLGKENLKYKTYPGYDHQFNQLHFEKGKVVGVTPKLTEVLIDVFTWLKENQEM